MNGIFCWNCGVFIPWSPPYLKKTENCPSCGKNRWEKIEPLITAKTIYEVLEELMKENGEKVI